MSNASFIHSSAENLTEDAATNEVRGIAEMSVRTGEGTDRPAGGDIPRTQVELLMFNAGIYIVHFADFRNFPPFFFPLFIFFP